MQLLPLLRALRPKQWIKNGFIPVGWFFALWDANERATALGWTPFCRELLAVICFSAIASAIYLINDSRDASADRLHPAKRTRPIASGELSVRHALCASLLLTLLGSIGAFLLTPSFCFLCCGYILMQLAYTFRLKQMPFVDVFIVALGFVLRAIAGTLVVPVRLSPWLLLCVFLLALFLALCKRRHERVALDGDTATRSVLAHYTPALLDMQIGIVAACVISAYSMYTLSTETIQRFHNEHLGLTIPFVVFGLFRYLHLVYNKEQGGAPEMVLLTDRTIICTVLGFFITVVLTFLC